MPEPADLFRPGRAEPGHSDLSLFAAAGRLSVSRHIGECQPVRRSVHAAGQEEPHLPQPRERRANVQAAADAGRAATCPADRRKTAGIPPPGSTFALARRGAGARAFRARRMWSSTARARSSIIPERPGNIWKPPAGIPNRQIDGHGAKGPAPRSAARAFREAVQKNDTVSARRDRHRRRRRPRANGQR